MSDYARNTMVGSAGSASAYQQSSATPISASTLQRELDRYNELLGELHSVINGVTERLVAVAPERVEKGPPSPLQPNAPVSSPIAGVLQDHNGKLVAAILRLSDLLARIDL